MSTLLLRLAGPLQSWGIESKFDTRRTGSEPSKSGVVGLLAAALGRRRDASLSDLAVLKMGIRIDQPGVLLRDFHMAHPDPLAKQSKAKDTLTTRYYLSDAVFLVGLESADEAFLEQLEEALRQPVFPLFLGRRSCPVTLPLTLGVRQTDLLTTLRNEPWQSSSWRQRKLDPQLRLLSDALPSEPDLRRQKDSPISFSPLKREYGYRSLRERGYVNVAAGDGQQHDPFAELEVTPCT